MKHLAIYKYPVLNKKGRIIRYIKQVYMIDYDTKFNIGGQNETGYGMHFYPEGTMSSECITEKMIMDSLLFDKHDFARAEIHIIKID